MYANRPLKEGHELIFCRMQNTIIEGATMTIQTQLLLGNLAKEIEIGIGDIRTRRQI